VLHEGLGIVLRLLAPIAPHVTQYLWRELGFGADLLAASWPGVDEEALRQEHIEYVVQVNGKVRAKLQIAADAAPAEIERAVLASAAVQRLLGGAPVSRVIVVPGRLVNLVIRQEAGHEGA
jgi:leucyl-tRNA synthetase